MDILKVSAFFFWCCLSSSATADEWRVNPAWLDPFAGETVSAASVANEGGFEFVLFRSFDGRVRALYSLPRSSFDRLPVSGRVVMIRPGSERSVEIEATIGPDRWGGWTRSDGIAVRASMWHGGDPSPTTGTLRNILNSDTLYARFFTDDGRTIDTSWSLEGSHEAIAQALQIETSISEEEQEWASFVTDTLIAAGQRCGINTECTDALADCIDILVNDHDEEGFARCMTSRGF